MDFESLLLSHGIKPTSNRIVVLKVLCDNDRILSIRDIEERLVTMDKSSIFRCLRLFTENHLIHEIEDGSGMLKYELCTSVSSDTHDDMHPHFYCERCRQTVCLKEVEIPTIGLREGFVAHHVNFIIKGLCAKCSAKE